jgi:Transposase domain (DUF772)/Transposase DDE domain
MAMVLLLQAYAGASDATAVELSLLDLRWQMVLGCLGATEPLFSRGALFAFRERLIKANLDRRLLERTVELARETKAFDPKKLPKALRVAMDSSPLEGAGRSEDTINLLAHAGRKIVACAANLLGWTEERVGVEAGAPLLLESSVKQVLDLNWSDPDEKAEAIPTLLEQLTNLEQWVAERLPEELHGPPLREHVATLHQIIEQDLEPDPNDPGGAPSRIRQAVAEDRRVSIEDKEMRHGRKTKSSASMATSAISRSTSTPSLSWPSPCCLPIVPNKTPRPPSSRISRRRDAPSTRSTSAVATSTHPSSMRFARAGDWSSAGPGSERRTLQQERVHDQHARSDHHVPGWRAATLRTRLRRRVSATTCHACPLRAKCTDASPGRGRKVEIAANEPLQHQLRKRAATPAGRRQLRKNASFDSSMSAMP